MKHKIVGWVDWNDDSYDDTGNFVTYAERQTIIDEIQNKGYLFTGYMHQEFCGCTPVFNDGKKRIFTTRNWGSIMAEAHGFDPMRDYANFSFWASIDTEDQVMPDTDEWLFDKSVTPDTDRAEHITVAVKSETLDYAKKHEPFFLNEEGRLKYLDAGDTLTLTCGEESFTARVTGAGRCDKDNCPVKIDTKRAVTVYFSEDE